MMGIAKLDLAFRKNETDNVEAVALVLEEEVVAVIEQQKDNTLELLIFHPDPEDQRRKKAHPDRVYPANILDDEEAVRNLCLIAVEIAIKKCGWGEKILGFESEDNHENFSVLAAYTGDKAEGMASLVGSLKETLH